MTKLVRSAALWLLPLCCGIAPAQNSTLEHPLGESLPYFMDTGALDNPANQIVQVAAFPVHMNQASWMRLYFDTADLPEGSYVVLTSMKDGEFQVLDRVSMAMWSDSSAYFNGDTVVVELFAGPKTDGTRLKIKRIGAEIPAAPVGDPGQCGICNGDQRVPTNELWSGRIMPVGCTGSVYCATGTGMITAGHCLQGQSNLVVQFNVPASNANCSTNAPPVNDQFPVLPGFQFQNAGIGNDWGVYLTGPNGAGQTPFQRYGQFRALAPVPAGVNTNTNIWGYGLDTNCVRSQTQQNSNGVITVQASDHYQFTDDVRGGNSGSGFLNASNQIIGVVTHCSFAGCPNYATRIDQPNFVAGRNSVNNNCLGGILPPTNDSCGAGIAISPGTYTGTTTGASTEGSACATSGADVWYTLYCTCTGTYTFDTCGSNFDTVLSVHTGCPGTTANMLACNDDSGTCGGSPPRQSFFTVNLTAGTAYTVRVAGFGSTPATGNYVLHIVPPNPPSNDNCANAIGIGYGSIDGNTSCASNDGNANCISYVSNDVWYTFVPPCTGTYSADTCTNGAFDTLLSVHTACPGNGANAIACNDDSCGLLSRLSWTGIAGTRYYIRVAGFFANRAGPFTLTISRGGDNAPGNDTCANASLVGPGTYSGSTTCAGVDGSATCALSDRSPDVWYAIDGGCGGFVQVDTIGSSYDTALSVHTGCPGTAANIIACDDDAGGSLTSKIVFLAQPNTRYYVRVAGFNGSYGNYVFHVNKLPNDACANAIGITDGSYPFDNRGATTDGSAAGICLNASDNNVNQDLWYIYQASCNGTVTVNTCGSSFDTKVAAYTGTSCGNTSPIACNDDFCGPSGVQSQITFDALAGDLFLIRVGGWLSNTGCGVLNVSCNGCAVCAADYNQDGGVDGSDVNAFFFDWEGGLPCADVNQDGGIDGQDVDYFYSVWERGNCDN
ncbi:MAG: hypothetical protein JSR77_16035 [Planctomycetes bacterium]|nr:hypothetical protein [Planctomycetota bacterium]